MTKISSESSDELTRFQKLARALFRVEKKDVAKHEPKKRHKQPSDGTPHPGAADTP